MWSVFQKKTRWSQRANPAARSQVEIMASRWAWNEMCCLYAWFFIFCQINAALRQNNRNTWKPCAKQRHVYTVLNVRPIPIVSTANNFSSQKKEEWNSLWDTSAGKNCLHRKDYQRQNITHLFTKASLLFCLHPQSKQIDGKHGRRADKQCRRSHAAITCIFWIWMQH